MIGLNDLFQDGALDPSNSTERSVGVRASRLVEHQLTCHERLWSTELDYLVIYI
jgi:hypothetical protein